MDSKVRRRGALHQGKRIETIETLEISEIIETANPLRNGPLCDKIRIMIKGIGIDICDIKRLQTAIKKNKRFLKRVYSEREIAYCSAKKNSILNFAGRFALKEAFIKAVSTDKTIKLKEIETVNNAHGKPEIVLSPVIKAILKKKKGKSLSISISHTHDAAAAVCIIT